jgi:hypothetical protein
MQWIRRFETHEHTRIYQYLEPQVLGMNIRYNVGNQTTIRLADVIQDPKRQKLYIWNNSSRAKLVLAERSS